MIHSPRTTDLLRHLAGRPGHDEVKADFRQLLTEEFGVQLHDLDFERRVPEVKGRLDALIGRTIFEAKKNCYSACDFDPLKGVSASKIDPLQLGLMRCSL